jgi:hypothetical protein
MKFSHLNCLNTKLSRAITHSLCLLSFSQLSVALPQYINEFHYDNKGADQFEYVEIAGISGSDLSGWQLDFYNGTNGTIYASWALSGVIDDEMSGFGALSFSGSTGLQNGPNDGIALINDLGDLVQFISYEGSLTGTEGAALGVTSQDIGLSESSSVALGSSLQLTGMGTDSEDFIWASGISSFGDLNSGQSYNLNTPNAPVQSVNEPQTLGLMGVALLALFAGRKKSKL